MNIRTFFEARRFAVLLVCSFIVYSLIAIPTLRAQVSSYTFRTGNLSALAYSSVANGTVVSSGTAIDGQFFPNIAIGFPLTFNGANYSTLTISANGYVLFGGTAPTAPGYYSVLGQNLGEAAIAALGVGLRGVANSQIVTQLTGTAPNRSFIVQWQNVGISRFSNAAPTDIVSFQIRLDETSNAVSIGYGTFTLTDGAGYDCEVGLRGSSDVIALAVQPATDALPDPWASSQASPSGDTRCRLTLTQGASGQTLQGTPKNNLVFAWNAAPSLATPALQSPTDKASVIIPGTFTWAAVPGATSYEFTLLAPNGGSYNPITVQTNSVDFNLTTSNAGYSAAMFNPNNQGAFGWRVQAIGTAGGAPARSPASETRTFTPRAQPIVKTISERTWVQGQSVNFTITGENTSFSAAATPTIQFTPNAGGTAIAAINISVQNATTIAATVSVPASAVTSPYKLTLTAGTDVLTANDAVTVVSSANPPVQAEFSPVVHGFNFSNSGSEMWNEAVFGKINYNSAAYPAEVRALNPQSSDFPSWDDFVAVFERGRGESAFTANGTNRTPRQEVLTAWRSEKKAWGGSCGGFATAALMAYSGRYTFSAPAYRLPNGDNLRAMINRNQVAQSYGTILGSMDNTPNDVVQQIRTNFTQPKEDLFMVAVYNIVNGENKGGHALVPYKIVTTNATNGDVIDNVYVYDMNYPGDNNRAVIVNRTKNTWQYFGFLNVDQIAQGAAPWQGPNGFFPYLSAKSSAAVQQLPALFAKGVSVPSVLATAPKTELPVEIYFADDNDSPKAPTPRVTVSNRFSQSIANTGALLIKPQIPGARVVVPISTGANVESPGMTIPKQALNAFSIRYTPTTPNSYNFTAAVWKRLTGYGEWTASVTTASQTVDVDFDKDAIRMAAGAQSSNVSLTLSKTDPTDSLWLDTVTLSEINLAANDSLSLQFVNDGNSFVVTNYGAARTYKLFMERYDTTSFRNLRIGIKESQTLLIEDWDNIGTCDVQVKVNRNLALPNRVDTSYFLRKNGHLTTDVRSTTLVDAELLRFEVYPNPASEQLSVSYVLPSDGHVSVDIVNMLGQRVVTLVDAVQKLGRHTVPLDVRSLENGAYLCRIQAGGMIATKLMRVLR